MRRATAAQPAAEPSIFHFIRDMLLLTTPESVGEEDRAEQRRFAGKFQQVTAPVMAKGIEDTAFYVYNRLVSLNEVGGEPGRFGVQPDGVARLQPERQAQLAAMRCRPFDPRHQAQRGRARPHQRPVRDARGVEGRRRPMEPAQRAAPRPGATSTSRPRRQRGIPALPDAARRLAARTRRPRNAPTFVERIQEFMLKALHEAKVHTSWINPNAEYDEAVTRVRRPHPRRGRQRRVPGRLPRLPAEGRRLRHLQLAVADAAEARLARACRTCTRARSCGTSAWSTPTTAGRSTTTVAAGCSRSCGRPSAPGGDLRRLARELVAAKEDGRIKLYITHRALSCRAITPGSSPPASTSPWPPRDRRPRTCSPSPAATARPRAVVAVPRLVARLSPEPGRPPMGAEAWQDTRLPLDRDGPGPPLAQRSSAASS